MISRYSRPAMSALWSEENKLTTWLKIEILVARTQANLNIIPQSAADHISQKASFNLEKVKELEKETKHELLAFLTNLSENLDPKYSRFLHYGLTSSDILDTGLSIILRESSDILLENLENLLEILKSQALKHKNTLCVGRTHGIHAEPTTFGLKLLNHYAAFKRAKLRLEKAKQEISTCKLSGAIGHYGSHQAISPQVESLVAQELNLKPEPISTQVIPRDRHAVFFSTLAIIASQIENLATEIRHLQRTEVREVSESFSKNQKGSSAMPHKKNPISSENLTGLARIIRSNLIPSLENITLWHERDISHSSVERIIAPDTCITLDFALARLSSLIQNLNINSENMTKNLNQNNGLIFSQAVLLALTQAGVSREEAYQITQKCALKSLDTHKSFKNYLSQEDLIKNNLSSSQLAQLFDPSLYLTHINKIFERVIS